jgi:endonuclease/exonuclease/phosphatase family metal-dependent hydrolase
VGVDVKVRGKSFRLISTHLDFACLPFTSAIQRAQAAEILLGPAATRLPVVLVGDFNSPGDGSGVTYNDVIAGGFTDAALEAGAGGIPTCCQAADLLNPDSILDSRVDFVFVRDAFTVLGVDIVGENPADRTASGLWPSDHAGVAATLELPQP